MPRKRSTCHPSRNHYAHGLCRACWSSEYGKMRRAAMTKKARAESLKRMRKYTRAWRARRKEQALLRAGGIL